MIGGLIFGFAPLAVWLYLIFGRGFFWLARERDDRDEPIPDLKRWPSVTAVVPARNEADVLSTSLGSLLLQDYPGDFRIVLVDDQSTDGTADVARALGRTDRLEILASAPRPSGWTGKLWAVEQGVDQATAEVTPEYIWLTDADIAHTPDNLRRLVVRAEQESLVLVSLMAKLRCESFAEKFLIPAFVFFFDMLFPFARVNDPHSRVAAAAGGCMLAKRQVLQSAGGITAIRQEIIDDCALARRMKAQGHIWLGLTNRAVSLRPYPRVGDVRQMVSRSAYAQLNYSLLLLTGTCVGMILVYIAAPFAALATQGVAQLAGWAAWLLMAIAFQPMLRFYRVSPLWGFALPVIGAVYTAFTLDSAIQFWRGRGGVWKGRPQALGRV